MKHFLSLQGRGVSNTSAMTVGSPSVDRRYSRLKPLFLAMLFLIAGIGQAWADTYALYSESTIAEGDYIIVAYGTSAQKYYAMNNTCTSDQYMGIEEVSVSNDNKITTTSSNIVWSISATDNGYYIKNGSNFLNDNATSNKNYAQLVSSATNTCIWTFAISSGKWTITNYGTTTTKKTLSFNIGSTRVATYASAQSGANQIYLYKKEEGGDPTPELQSIAISGTPSKTSYEAGDAFDITGLTVTGSYDIGDDAAITEGITWEARTSAVADDAAALNAYTLTAGQTALQVRATVSEIASSWFDVTGLTVNEHVVTPGEYTITFNNAFFGTTGLNGSLSGTDLKDYTGSQNDITIDYKKGTGSNMYLKDSEIRLYAGNSLVVNAPAGYVITKVDKLVSGINADKGEIEASYIWTGKESAVTFSKTGSGGLALSSFKVTYAAIAPEVTVDPASLSFEAKQNIAVEGKTFTLEGANLTSGLTLTASTGFSVSPTSLTAEAAMVEGGVEVTVTPATPTATTTPVEGTVTISGGGLASDVEVALSMAVTPTYAVALAVSDGDMGSATINGGTATVYVTEDDIISLIASPNNGYDFVNWTVSDENIALDNKNAASTTALAGAAGTITANFKEIAYSITSVSANNENYGTVSLSGMIITANPAEGYRYATPAYTVTPEGKATVVQDGNSFTVSNLTDNCSIVINFELIPTYTAKWIVNGDTEHPYASQTAIAGADLNVPNNPEASGNCEGLVFQGWVDEAISGSQESAPEYITTEGLKMPENGATYYAVFAEEVPGAEVTNTYTHTIEAKTWSVNGPQTLSNVSWTLANNGSNYGYDATKGQQIGSGNNPASTMTLTTSGISGKITSVKIYTSGANSIAATVSASVNGVAYKYDNSTDPVAISASNTGYEFTGSETGEIVISWTQTSSKALYFKQIEVKYATPSASTYTNYVTTCVACSRVTLNAAEVENGSIVLKQGETTPENVKTCEGEDVEIMVEANPAQGYGLSTVNLSGVQGATYANGKVTIPENATGTLVATAVFALVDYAVSYTTPSNGTYTIKVGEAEAVSANTEAKMGQMITLAAAAAEGYRFTGWTVTKTASSTVVAVENNAFTMPNEAVTIAANFARVYSVADFIAIQDKGTATYCIEGIVSNVKSLDPTQYTNAQYYISANGQRVDEVYIYNGKYLDGADFTSTSQLAVGDKVIVCGTWDATHSSINAGNYLIYRLEGAHESYEIAGNLTQTAFAAGDKWYNSYLSGLTVNDVYNTGYKADVTSAFTITADKDNEAVLDAEVTVITVTATNKENEELKIVKAYDVEVSAATLSSIALKEDDGDYQTKKVYYVGEDFVAPTIVATLSDNSHFEATASYKSGFDNENPGVQSVTVSYTRGDNTETTSYDVTVKAIYNNESEPHTVAKAIEFIDASSYNNETSSPDYMWVSGIVSQVNSNVNNNGTFTYYISDNGSTTGQLQVYNGKYFGNVNFEESTKVAVGDQVTLKATILKYHNSKAELTSSQVTSQLREGALTVNNVASFEVGQPDLAEADLTINRHGSTGAITFSCDENDALEIVDNKLHAKGTGTADVTVTATMAADNTENQINFTEASTTFTVHVIPPQVHYHVTFDMDGGSTAPSLDDQLENANVVIPAGTYTKDGYKFNGWTAKETESGDAITVTENAGVYSFTMPAAAVTVTAQWAEGSDFAWVASDKGYENAQDITTATEEADPISIVFAKETAQNGPKYYTSGTAVRTYAGNTVTIATKSDTKLINKITFTYGDKNVVADGLSEDKLTWTGLAKEVVLTTSGGQAHYKTINVTYINGTVTTLSIAPIALKTSDEETALSITKNVEATIIYEGLDESVATIADNKVTPVGIGSTTVTARIAQGANYTAAETEFTITVAAKTIPVMSFPQASYDANLGESFTAPTLTKPEGVTVAYSSDNAAVSVDENTGAITINAEGTAVITATSVENEDYSVGTASYTLHVIDPTKDVLTANAINVTSYGDGWGEEKTFGSGVKYVGNSTTGTGDYAGTIQMRKDQGSGIVTTTAIGYLKSISATETKNGSNNLYIYAKGTAYESAADLHDADKRGELIGTISKDGGAMTFEDGKAYTDNYKYIGIKANGGAVYYDDITITWEPAEFEHFNVTFNAGEASGEPVVESIEEGSNISLKAADTFEAPEGKMFAGWLLEGEENVREAGSKYTVTAAATFTAQWISVYTITYKAGEGTGDDVVVENVPVGNYQLAENTFTAPESKEFAGWKLNNDGELLAANSDFEVTGDAEFTAQWSVIKQDAGLVYATTSYTIIRGREFTAPTLTNDYGVEVTYSGNKDEVATVDAATGAITLQGGIGTVTVTASFAGNDYYYADEASYTLKVMDANLVGGWKRLTSSSVIEAGMNVIIAQYVSNSADIKTMGVQNANNRAAVAGKLEDNVLAADETTEILTLEAVGENTFALKTADGRYLYAASSSSNYLKSQVEIDGNATWTISLSADGKATITAQGDNTHKLMRYNSNNGIFSCYTGNQQDIALYSKTVRVSGNTDASTLEDYADVNVANGANLTIDSDKPLNNVRVKAGSTVTVSGNNKLDANSLIVEKGGTLDVQGAVTTEETFVISTTLGQIDESENPDASGSSSEINKAYNIAASGNVYIEIELTQDAAASAGWYAFSVPFPVDALHGVYFGNTQLVNEQDYAIMSYHGDLRAQGLYGWKKYSGTMQPGVLYIIAVGNTDYKTLRFKKLGNDAFRNSIKVAVSAYASQTGNDKDGNWNGLGNPNMLRSHNSYGTYMQFLDHANNAFKPRLTTDVDLVLGSAFFIQYEGSSDSIDIATGTSGSIALAPARTGRSVENTIYEVKLRNSETNKVEDNLFMTAREDATNTYEIGRDLAKMSMGTAKCAQMFVQAYNTNLCAADFPLVDDKAIYPLTMTAPVAGTYIIEAAKQYEDADLYLMQDGSIIWNLSMSVYEFELNQGTTEGYSLMVRAKAPNATTDLDNIYESDVKAQKVVVDGQFFILRDKQMYDATGKAVR